MDKIPCFNRSETIEKIKRNLLKTPNNGDFEYCGVMFKFAQWSVWDIGVVPISREYQIVGKSYYELARNIVYYFHG